jgi:hypothetical protein
MLTVVKKEKYCKSKINPSLHGKASLFSFKYLRQKSLFLSDKSVTHTTRVCNILFFLHICNGFRIQFLDAESVFYFAKYDTLQDFRNLEGLELKNHRI